MSIEHIIKLGPFRQDDFETLISWIDTEEHLVQFAGDIFTFPLTNEQLKQYLEDAKRHAFRVFDAATNKTIGLGEAYQFDQNTVRLCRILIGNLEYRGKGLGKLITRLLIKFSFEKLNADSVCLNVYDWNKGAIKCYEKAGFQKVEIQTGEIMFKGKIWTTIKMQIDKVKFEAD